ncbi:Spectrin beta chain [Aphelenchoides bicaudatus]|nr:Spectrin beta chain [Aphelenchoides bicaudatus]
MPHHPHWDLIASAVREKMKNTSYKNIIFGDVSQFKKEAGTFEDQIARKQICTSGKRLTPRREWRTLYAVLKDNTLSFYKDIVYRRNDATYHDEAPLIIDGATTVIETSSKTRKYLIRLKLHDGSEYVLQCQTISQWARWLAELNITIKRHTPHTTITTPFESSISESSIKSNVSSIPSTPSYTKHIVLNVTTVESRRSSSVDEGIDSPATVPNNLGSLVTGVVETPHPRVLLAGIVSIDNSIDESIVEHQGTIKSDINNNEFTLDFSNQTSSDSLV